MPAPGPPVRGDAGDRWAHHLVFGAGMLLAAAGVLGCAASLRPQRLYDLLVRVVGLVTAQQPGFLTIEWVDATVRPVAVAVLLLGVLLVLFRRPASTLIAPAVTAVARSAERWRRRIPPLIAAEIRETGWIHWATLALILAAGAALRAVFLNDAMRYDEAFTYHNFVSQPFRVGLSVYPVANNHLLNTVLSHFSTRTIGSEAWAIRLPVFVAGNAVVLATYVLGRLVYGRGAALVGTALVAGSSALIEYSANARGYSFIVLAFVLLLAVARSLARNSDPILWTVFALLAAIGMFAVPTMAYAIAVVALWLAVETTWQRRRPDLRVLLGLVGALSAAVILTLVLYLPVILVGTSGLLQRPEHLSDVASLLRETWRQWTRDLPGPVPVLVATAAVLGLALHRRLSTVRVPPLAAAAPVVLLAIAFAGRSMPYRRVWLFLLPLFLLSAAAGVAWAVGAAAARLRSRLPLHEVVAVVIALAMAVSVLTDPGIRRDNEGQDGPAITAWLKPRLSANGGKVVSVTPLNMVLIHYFIQEDLSAEHIVGAVEPTMHEPLFVIVPGGKSLGMMTGDAAYPPGEGQPYSPIPGLGEALGPAPRLVKTFPTARIYTRASA